jgi:amidase
MEDGSLNESKRFDRKHFVGATAAVAAAPALASLARAGNALAGGPAPELEEATIAALQAAMTTGNLTALALVQKYKARINVLDAGVRSVIELNPEAEAIARRLDAERSAGHTRGPLHGIPILLKANIDTGDRMQTTAGSLALVGTPPGQDSTVAENLRRAGAVILGKTNLSEWANFRGFNSTSGWSGVGGLTHNPYVLDCNACGSSSGSGAATSALCRGLVGTETDGSIVCPANENGVVGIKPTVGLTSRAGVVPISHSQDTVGPHARTVADAAAVLTAIVSRTADPRDPATSTGRNLIPPDYTAFVDAQGLQGARIGIPRAGVFDTIPSIVSDVFDAAVAAMQAAGATIVDPADIPTIDAINSGADEITVLLYEFKRDLNAYLATRTGVPNHTLADAIAFNTAHADAELKWFGQELFELAEADLFSDAEYAAALANERKDGGPDGIDAALAAAGLDALIMPTDSPAWTTDLVLGDHFIFGTSSPAAIAGYPIVNVPMGNVFGLPIGVSFVGTAFSEPKLITLASGFEAASKSRIVPQFLATLPADLPRGHRGGEAGARSAARLPHLRGRSSAAAEARGHRGDRRPVTSSAPVASRTRRASHRRRGVAARVPRPPRASRRSRTGRAAPGPPARDRASGRARRRCRGTSRPPPRHGRGQRPRPRRRP